MIVVSLVVFAGVVVLFVVIDLLPLVGRLRGRATPVSDEASRTVYEVDRLAFDTRLAIRELRRSRRRS